MTSINPFWGPLSTLLDAYLTMFYSDADLERLYQQWEEDDEDLPLDELPDWDPRSEV